MTSAGRPHDSGLNAALWEQLRADPQRWHDTSRLANRLGFSEPSLARDVAALQAFGYGIECHPYHGLHYLHPAERLCPDQIEWNLDTQVIGRKLSVWNRLDSTQSVAAKAAKCSANHGLVVLAEEQTAGRGRRGRTWRAPRHSSILMSVVAFPPPAFRDQSWLTAWAAVAAGQMIEQVCGHSVRIKRPNDVLVGTRKVCGILVEQFRRAYVVGIGLNVNLAEHDFPPELRATAASLMQLTGTPQDRSELARRLIARLDALYVAASRHGPDALWQWWRERLTNQTPAAPVDGTC